MIVEGTVLVGREFAPIEGQVVIEDDRIVDIHERSVDSADIIFPAFVNSHTHIGDSIAKEAGEGLDLEALVAPPDGLKHRILRASDQDSLINGMYRSARFMQRSGTSTFIDFREGGDTGVTLLQTAVRELEIDPVILGRDSDVAVRTSDGLGASSVRDDTYSEELEAVRATGKLCGIHAGERDDEDITGAFDLEPDFLVHMVHPRSEHLDRLERSKIPVVVCPRSNLVTGAGTPPIAKLLEHTTVALGTDNVMLNSPSMFREMEFTAKLTGLPAREILWMATGAGAEIAGLSSGIIEPDRPAKLIVLDGDTDNLCDSHDTVRAVVRRAGVSDVKRVIL